MSYKSDYVKINIAAEGNVRQALSTVVERHGWELIDNNVRVENGQDFVQVRAHETISENFPLVIKNPDTSHRAYDIGIRIKEDNNMDLVFDRYLDEVHKEWGREANGLVKETIIETARQSHNSTVQSWPFNEFLSKYVKDPETGEAISQEDLLNLEQDVQLNSLDCPIAQLV